VTAVLNLREVVGEALTRAWFDLGVVVPEPMVRPYTPDDLDAGWPAWIAVAGEMDDLVAALHLALSYPALVSQELVVGVVARLWSLSAASAASAELVSEMHGSAAWQEAGARAADRQSRRPAAR
jgi:hypothetical protein